MGTRRAQPGCLCASWRQETEHWGLTAWNSVVLFFVGKPTLRASAVGSTCLPYRAPWTECLHPPQIHMWKPYPPVMVFGDGAFGR